MEWRQLAILLLSIALCTAHRTLWVGALTPVVGTITLNELQGFQVPLYDTDTTSSTSNTTTQWANNELINKQDCHTTYFNGSGVFTPCAASTLSTRLLTSASQASLSKDSGSNILRQKNDETGYRYSGRSYGVGASVGLWPLTSHSDATFFNYTEPGYQLNISCAVNMTSDWYMQEFSDDQGTLGIPHIYWAEGRLPNGDWSDGASVPRFAMPGLGGDGTMVALTAREGNGRHMAAITAGISYAALNKTQCEIVYEPRIFGISANTTERVITVVPLEDDEARYGNVFDDSTAALASTATLQLHALGMSSTNLYISSIGEALDANIGAAASTNISQETAIADSLTSILEDILVFVASYQIVLGHNATLSSSTVQTTAIDVQIPVVRLGDAKYSSAVVALCLFHLVLTAVDACRTRLWKHVPKFDVTDAQSLLLATARGGDQMKEHVDRVAGIVREEAKKKKDAQAVTAEAVDERVCELTLRLNMNGEHEVLIPDD